jgi:hypothetical protein
MRSRDRQGRVSRLRRRKFPRFDRNLNTGEDQAHASMRSDTNSKFVPRYRAGYSGGYGVRVDRYQLES